MDDFRNNPDNSAGHRGLSVRPGGFTLVELLIAIVIMGILAGLIFGVVGKVKDAANRANCRSNMRQIAAALVMYRDAYGDYPPAIRIKQPSPFIVGWHDVLVAEGVNPRLFICPCDEGHGSYEERQASLQEKGVSYEYYRGPRLVHTSSSPQARAIGDAAYAWGEEEDILIVCPHHYYDIGGRHLMARSDGSVKAEVRPSFVK